MSSTDEHLQHEPAAAPPPPATAPATVIAGGPIEARVSSISPEAADELRRHVEAASGGGNRFLWFIYGFVAALVAGVVASIVFLVVSDADDDGDIQIDVPEVDVDIGD